MKIRTGFVANSSSSSFLFIGKIVKMNEIDLTDGEYFFAGKFLVEGQDIIFLNNELFDFIKKVKLYEIGDCGDFYKIYKSSLDGNPLTFLPEEFPPKQEVNVYDFCMDQHYSSTIEEIIDNYEDDIDMTALNIRNLLDEK